MRVIIEKSVLESDSVDLLALLTVFQLCRQPQRHFLLVDEKSLATWCTRLGHPKNLRDSLNTIAKNGRNESKARRSPEIRIVGNDFSWAARMQQDTEQLVSPRVRAADAVKILQAPLRLLVENGRNDGAFLLRMALGSDRARLEHAIEMGWVIFENAGGLGEMKRILEKIATLDDKKSETWVRWLRLWVMFDRDAHKDDRTRPSKDSAELLTLIELFQQRIGASWAWPGMKRLERRAIENYLPKQGLNAYVDRLIRIPTRNAVEKMRMKRSTINRWRILRIAIDCAHRTICRKASRRMRGTRLVHTTPFIKDWINSAKMPSMKALAMT